MPDDGVGPCLGELLHLLFRAVHHQVAFERERGDRGAEL